MSGQTGTGEFEQIREILTRAKLGSFLVIPLKYEKGALREEELLRTARRIDLTTMDLTDPVKELFRADGQTAVGACYEISRADLVSRLLGESGSFTVYREGGESYSFDFFDSYLCTFHTQTAFLCLGLRYDRMEALALICSPGQAENEARYRLQDGSGRELPFDLEERLSQFCGALGLEGFFAPASPLLLEAYVYTLAVVSRRFDTLECMRQVTFNLHKMSPLDSPVEDSSEEDVRYVYAVKNQQLDGTYRWGACVSSQTVSYVVADGEMDVEGELHAQARDGLPLVLLALYEKYTCLRFTQLIAGVDKRKMKQLRALKRLMLEFRAYGTVQPANVSRWHNVKRIYEVIVETNGVPAAVEDVNCKLNILVEHQREIEAARNDAVAWVLTLFGIVSILASVLSIIQILSGGNPLEWFVTIMSTLLIALLVAVAVIFGRKED